MDLITFPTTVVCFNQILHHQHSNVDDARINESPKTEVVGPVSLASCYVAPHRQRDFPCSNDHSL